MRTSEIAALRSLSTTLSAEVTRGHTSTDAETRGRAAGCAAARTSLEAMAQLYGWWESGAMPQPDAVYEHGRLEGVARWGEIDVPMPAVYSSLWRNGTIEAGEARMSFDDAEAFAARILTAVAYERLRAAEAAVAVTP